MIETHLMSSCVTLSLLVSLLGLTSISAANADEHYVPCLKDPSRLELRSKELATIVKADQDDRKDWQKKPPTDMTNVAKRDLARRKRIGEIFGEGCFSKAEDYAAAALVFQHGDAPEHFFQTFLWAKRAVELGDASQSRLLALGIDRYLINIGQKQLFGSQASKPDFKSDTCWCLSKIERSFPDKLRKKYAGKKLTDVFDWLKELNAGNTCPNTECSADLKASPRGTVPGFW